MNLFSKIFKQTSWQIFGKAVTSFSTFVILGLVARNYSKEGLGIFTLTLTYLAIFYMLSDFGFNAHVLKKLKTQKSKVKSEWRKLLGTRVIWSGILVILALGLLPFLPFTTKDFDKSVYLGSLAILGSGVFTTCNLIFQSRLRYDLSVLASSLGTMISLVVFYFLILQKLPAPFLLFAHFLGWIVIALGALILIRRFAQDILPIFDFRYTISLVKESWPIAATLALNVIYFRADSFMIAYFRNTADVGIYNVAYSVFQSALVLPTFIMNSYYPLMLKSLSTLKQMTLGLFGLSVLGILLVLFLAPLIINILTGGDFDGSTQSLRILSMGFPAYFLSSILMWFLITKGKYKVMFFIYTSGLLLNLALNFLFIPKYSYIAASWTTVITEYVILGMQIMLIWLSRR